MGQCALLWWKLLLVSLQLLFDKLDRLLQNLFKVFRIVMLQIWAEFKLYFNAVIVQNLKQRFTAFKAVLIRVTTADIDSGSGSF